MLQKKEPQHVWGTSCADPASPTVISFIPHSPVLKAGNTCPLHRRGGVWSGKQGSEKSREKDSTGTARVKHKQKEPTTTPPRIHTPPSAGQGQTPAGLRVQAGTAGGARSQENCRDAEVQGGQRGCLKTHRSPGPQGSARRELAAPGQRPSQRPPTSSLDGSGHSADRCSQGRRTAPGSDPRWAGREAKHAGPALDSLRLVNKPHLTLETLTRGWDPPRPGPWTVGAGPTRTP